MPESLIGRVGWWCLHRRWWVLAAWTAAMIAGVLATGPLFRHLSDGGVPRQVESLAGLDVLNEGDDSAGTVVGVLDGVDRSKPDVRDAVTAASEQIGQLPGVRDVEQPFDPALPPEEAARLVSNDGQAVLITVKLGVLERPERDEAAAAVRDELHALADVLPPGARIEVGGSSVLSLETRETVKDDLRTAEFASLPITLIVLVLVFGGVVAAGLPVISAVVSVAAAMGVTLGFSYFADVDQYGVTVVTLLGLGLSVDYGLLLVARYREELLRGFAPDIAVARAWATAGRTIAFSALTVAAALTGLVAFDLPSLRAFGLAGVSIALISMLVSLTLTASLIGLLQRWIRPSKHRRRARLVPPRPAAAPTGPRAITATAAPVPPQPPGPANRRDTAAMATALRGFGGRGVFSTRTPDDLPTAGRSNGFSFSPDPAPAPPSPPASGNGRAEPDRDDDGFFARLSLFVQKRALIVGICTAGALLAAGAPLLGTEFKLPGLEGVPRTVEAARVADVIAARFAQPANPAITVVARTDASTLDAWAAKWRSDPAVKQIRAVRTVRDFPTDPLVAVSFDVVGDPQDAQALDLVERMRTDRPQGVQSWVIGDAAVLTDLIGLINAGLPAAVFVTVLAMLALLFIMTGSLVIPVKAILANLVSLGATFGVLTAVFGHGFLSGVLGTLTTGALNPFVVVVIFAFAFGLSMDYEVFLLARIKEFVDAGVDTQTAVRRGLQHSGRVITSAALLMVIVFGCFAAASIGNVEEIGLGLAVAVAIDATIVRCLLVPATMTLLGQWNWWAPPALVRLHERFGLREKPLPDEVPEPRRSVLSASARATLHAAGARVGSPSAAPSDKPAEPSLADLYRQGL